MKKKSYLKIENLVFAILFNLFIFSSIHINAQPASPEYDKGWFTIAAGAGYPFELNGALTANFGRTKFWQIALQSNDEFTLGGEASHINTVSASYGISAVNRIGRVAISAGSGIAYGLDEFDHDTNERPRFIIAALVGNAEVNITPIKELGIGLSLFGNLNPRLSTLGIMLSIAVEGHK